MELYFRHALAIALSPGVAIECRAGEIVDIEEPLAESLLRRRPDVVRRVESADVDVRRRPRRDIMLPPAIASHVAPEHDPDALIFAAEKAAKLAQAKRFLSPPDAEA